MPQIDVVRAAVTEFESDVVIVAVSSKDGQLTVPAKPGVVGAAVRRRIVSALTAVAASTKPGSITTVPADRLPATAIIAVGVGADVDALSPADLRRAAGAAVRAGRNHESLALALPARTPAEVAALAEGALLGAYEFRRYRSDSEDSPARLDILLPVEPDADHHDAVSAAEVIAEAVNHARDLVNTAPGHLRPSQLAQDAVDWLADASVDVEVMDSEELTRMGCGGILAVGQGSADAPRLVRVAYRPAGAEQHLAVVGKGITFDSGGLSLKPAKAMETMKTDMGGAAAVICAIGAIARLGLPVNVTAWAPLAENMPSGTAQRPGDVITMYGGQTVEVLNTDAEGRLVLADAMVRAQEEDPDLMIDIATLTGAQLVALGSHIAGVMGNRDDVRDAVYRSSLAAGDEAWPMPLPAALRPSLDSPIADISNIGDRNGGMLTAGLFLQHFVTEETPWVHMDIAGPAFNSGAPHAETPKGGTGAGVRTLVEVARRLAARELV